MRLQGRVAVVTGASRGIGKGIAAAYAGEGALVVVVARTEEVGRLPGTIHQTVEYHVCNEQDAEPGFVD